MRAGRLLNLLLLLQDGRRWTAAELARRLQVSERTVLRDVETLSGVGIPVYGVRGPGGGFELLDTFEHDVPPVPPGLALTTGRLRRVRVRIAPAALQLALVTGRPEGWRRRTGTVPPTDRPDWVEGSFRFDSYEAAARELVAIGPEIEVLLPAELRAHLADVGRRIAALHHTAHSPAETTAPAHRTSSSTVPHTASMNQT